MPFKLHEPQRHHIPKAQYRVTNWSAYDRGLVSRGDIRPWVSDDAIEGWNAPCRTTPGGQKRYSNLATETVLIVGALVRFPLRQSEGFVRSLIALMGLDLHARDVRTARP